MENAVATIQEATKNETSRQEAPRNVGLNFNANAVMAFLDKHDHCHRFRMDSKDGKLFIRPTHRLKGKLVFADFVNPIQAGSTLKVKITEDQMRQLGVQINQGDKFNVVRHKYGWFFLSKDEEGIEGAKASAVKA